MDHISKQLLFVFASSAVLLTCQAQGPFLENLRFGVNNNFVNFFDGTPQVGSRSTTIGGLPLLPSGFYFQYSEDEIPWTFELAYNNYYLPYSDLYTVEQKRRPCPETVGDIRFTSSQIWELAAYYRVVDQGKWSFLMGAGPMYITGGQIYRAGCFDWGTYYEPRNRTRDWAGLGIQLKFLIALDISDRVQVGVKAGLSYRLFDGGSGYNISPSVSYRLKRRSSDLD